jgi:septum site-determining protein MinD
MNKLFNFVHKRIFYSSPSPYSLQQEQFFKEKLVKKKSRIIVITSGKGGVGKSTVTTNFGLSLAKLGYKIAVIDADIGLRNLDLLLGLEHKVFFNVIDVLEGRCSFEKALLTDKRFPNLTFISLVRKKKRYPFTTKIMKNLLEAISVFGFDFILIDCPAGIDIGFINAISGATEAIIVTTPQITAIRDADKVINFLKVTGIYDYKILVNEIRPIFMKNKDLIPIRDIQQMLRAPVIGAIPEDRNVLLSVNRGEPLVLEKNISIAGLAFENAARYFLNQDDFLFDVENPMFTYFYNLKKYL